MQNVHRRVPIVGACVVGVAMLSSAVANDEIVPLALASSTCFSVGGAAPRWNGKPVADCVASWTMIGKAQGAILYQGRYTRPSSDGPNAKLVSEVLFRGAAGSAQVEPILSEEEDETYNFLHPYTLHRVADRSIVILTACLNGTGGCGQDFFEYREGSVQPLTAQIRKEVEAMLPRGLTQKRAPHVDLDDLRGKGGAWTKADPNCCPSFEVGFDVRLKGNELHVEHVKVTQASEQ